MPIASSRTGRLPSRLLCATGALSRALLAGSLAGGAYLVVLVGYLAVGDRDVITLLQAAYPLVWIATATAGVAAVSTRRPRIGPAGVVAGVGYVLLLAWIGGQFSVGTTGFGASVTTALPGWGPIVTADLLVAGVIVVPFQWVGYLVLGGLFAAAVTATARSAVAGLAGLFTCPGCVLPLVGTLTAGGAVPLFERGLSYDVSTVAFVLTLGVLVAVVRRGTDPTVRERGATASERCD